MVCLGQLGAVCRLYSSLAGSAYDSGKYLYRGVLSEKNIISCENGMVTFRYIQNSGEVCTRTLPGADFLWLLLLHVLPRGFRRARTCGLLHPNSKTLIRLLQYLFRCTPSDVRVTESSRRQFWGLESSQL